MEPHRDVLESTAAELLAKSNLESPNFESSQCAAKLLHRLRKHRILT